MGEDNASALLGAFLLPSLPLPSLPLPSPFFFSFPFPFLFLSFPHGRFLCGIIARKEARASPLLFPLAAFPLRSSAQEPGTDAQVHGPRLWQVCRRARAGPPEQGGATGAGRGLRSRAGPPQDWSRAGAAHSLGKPASTVLNEALCAVPGTGLELSSGVSPVPQGQGPGSCFSCPPGGPPHAARSHSTSVRQFAGSHRARAADRSQTPSGTHEHPTLPRLHFLLLSLFSCLPPFLSWSPSA